MSDDLVLTPGGWRHRDFVHLIEDGHELSQLGTGEFAKREIATNNMIHFAKPPPGAQAEYLVHGPMAARRGCRRRPQVRCLTVGRPMGGGTAAERH